MVTPDCNGVSPFDGMLYGRTSSISAKYDVWQREIVCDSEKEFLLKGISQRGFASALSRIVLKLEYQKFQAPLSIKA